MRLNQPNSTGGSTQNGRVAPEVPKSRRDGILEGRATQGEEGNMGGFVEKRTDMTGTAGKVSTSRKDTTSRARRKMLKLLGGIKMMATRTGKVTLRNGNHLKLQIV